MPAALSSSSRSCEHVGGGRVDVGDRLGGDDDPARARVGRRERADVVAERARVGEEQRRVEAEDHEAGELLGLGVQLAVVLAGQARDRAERRLSTATRPGGTR